MYIRNEENVIFISELDHIDKLVDFLNDHSSIKKEGFFVVALDLEIEALLTEKEIPFISAKSYRTPDAALMTLSETWASSVLESKRWSFFAYRGVSLSRLYFLPLQMYLSYLIYYAGIVANIFQKHSLIKRVVVFPSSRGDVAMGSVLTQKEMALIFDVVVCVTKESGKEVIIPSIILPSIQRRHTTFKLKRLLFGFGITLFNWVISLVRRPREIRLLISDYWKNIAPYIQYLDSAEIILVDRQEAFKAGLKNIWNYRMRFLHIDAFSTHTSPERKVALTTIKGEWDSIKQNNDLSAFQYQGFSFRPLLMQALDIIVAEALKKILVDIDDTHAMIKKTKPHAVLLRATMSGQTHFVILAQVAHACGVPSFEVQHGLEYYGPGSYLRRNSAEFMGVYGPYVEKEMKAAGTTNSIPVVVGSPRFDVYAALKEKHLNASESQERVSFLCIAPPLTPGLDVDTYDVEQYYATVASAMRKTSNVHVIIKLRPGPNRDAFVLPLIESLFKGVSYSIAQFEPLAELFSKADVVISCYSTTAIEALAAGKPLIFLGLDPAQKLMGLHHFTKYAEHNALRLATTEERLAHAVEELSRDPRVRKKISDNAAAFLEKEYLFDGHASERTAEFIRSLVFGKK